MKGKYWKMSLCLLLGLCPLFASCTSGRGMGPETVALLLTGSINDAGWNASAYKGFLKAQEEYGFEGAYSESLQAGEVEEAVQTYADKGFKIIILASADFSEAGKAVAQEYPSLRFVLINGQSSQAPNLSNVRPRTSETGFLAGAFAGLITKTGTVGMIGGKNLPPIQDAMEGFAAGALYARPGTAVLRAYIDSFTDIAKGTEAAMVMIGAKADVVCSNTGQAALGTIEAARKKGISAVGYIEDQYKVAPGTVPFSVIQDVGEMVRIGVGKALAEEFKAEQVVVGAKEGVIRPSAFYPMGKDAVPVEIRERMEEIYQGIVDGSLRDRGILPEASL